MRISAAVRATILSWVAQDDSVSVVKSIRSVTGQRGALPLEGLPGAPSYLQWRYNWSSPNGVALPAFMANVFLHGGDGQDSTQIVSGRNELDGGAGSHFLRARRTGTDTFFTDERGDAPVWNALRIFHAGMLRHCGNSCRGVSGYYWDDQVDEAPGPTGATLRANVVEAVGRIGDGIDASITFAGLSVAQAKALHVSVGTQAAGSYLYFSYG